MNKFIYSIVCFIACITYSCTIETTTHFNKDYSGNSATTFDLSQMKAFAGSFSDNKEGGNSIDSLLMLLNGNAALPDSVKNGMDSMKMAFDKMGFHDFQLTGIDGSKLQASFNFDDLDVFNAEKFQENLREEFDDFDSGNMDEDMTGFMNMSTIKREDGWLVIDLTGGKYEELKKELSGEKDEKMSDEEMEMEDMGMEMMQGIGNMMTFQATYTFDRKIKEIECPLPYESDKHSITIDYTMADLFEPLTNEEELLLKVDLKESFFESIF